MAELSVSIVIPSYRDTPALAKLLPRLARHDCEIIVVGGERDTATATLCEHHQAQYLHTEPCRGAQLDAGAAKSSGKVIWFLHADAQPPEQAVAQIRRAVAQGASAGFFAFRFGGAPTAGKRILAAAINLRITLGGIPYGDQGLFATHAAYVTAGGFPHTPLFEEVPLVKRLRRQGRLVRLPSPMSISTRRWERDGWWRRSLHNRWLALRFMLGADPKKLAKVYAPPSNVD